MYPPADPKSVSVGLSYLSLLLCVPLGVSRGPVDVLGI